MSQRSEALADQFERSNAELISAVEACSDSEWKRTCNGEGWSVGVTAHHVAQSYPAFQGLILGIANGDELPPITREMLDGINQQHAVDAATCTREETLDLLRSDGKATADAVRSLSDAQLDRTAIFALAGNTIGSAAQLAEILIGHPADHLASIRGTLSGSAVR